MMEETSRARIEELLASQRAFFASQQTRSIKFRLDQLNRYRAAVLKYENRIAEALRADLHKSPEEAYLTETSIVLREIGDHIRHLKRWARPKRVPSPLFMFPSCSHIHYEPLGVALILAPWNYPFHLMMNPLVGAISSGCCAMLKASSPNVPETTRVMAELVSETFPPEYICMIHGDREVNRILLEQRFDFIFFTGSSDFGRAVMAAASTHLTPVVLELGGKSPCIVDRDADLKVAARRIMWGKTINAGQTCTAPDYLFVHADVKEELFREMRRALNGMFGDNPRESPYYPRIVNDHAVERLKGLMASGHIVIGGEVDESQRYIAPTVIDDIAPDMPIMQQEIFGPLLPVMTFTDRDQVFAYVNGHEKPLALYYFGKKRWAKEVLAHTTSGGGCVNDTLMHIANHCLPFGGVGNSGMGKYHGLDSFLAFTNRRAVVTTPTVIDLPLKYAPFKYFGIVKKILKQSL